MTSTVISNSKRRKAMFHVFSWADMILLHVAYNATALCADNSTMPLTRQTCANAFLYYYITYSYSNYWFFAFFLLENMAKLVAFCKEQYNLCVKVAFEFLREAKNCHTNNQFYSTTLLTLEKHMDISKGKQSLELDEVSLCTSTWVAGFRNVVSIA